MALFYYIMAGCTTRDDDGSAPLKDDNRITQRLEQSFVHIAGRSAYPFQAELMFQMEEMKEQRKIPSNKSNMRSRKINERIVSFFNAMMEPHNIYVPSSFHV